MLLTVTLLTFNVTCFVVTWAVLGRWNPRQAARRVYRRALLNVNRWTADRIKAGWPVAANHAAPKRQAWSTTVKAAPAVKGSVSSTSAL